MINPHLPFELDARDPDFVRKVFSWSCQVQREIQELVAATERTIATSRALMAEADYLLARK
jgi:hypothetical protein